jgi:hypothetical protein
MGHVDVHLNATGTNLEHADRAICNRNEWHASNN